jgi:hypothetical protein
VQLKLIDADSVPDLFWTVDHEEFVGGMLLVGFGTRARQAWATDEHACAPPELRDVNADGHLDIVEYREGALSAAECREDAMAEACHDRYPTDWVVAWLQEDAKFVNDSVGARHLYADLADSYGGAARELRAAIGAGTVPSARCSPAMADALDAMARRARQIAGGEPNK